MPELRILFTGLCAGGPPGPLNGQGDLTASGPYEVVMPRSIPRPAQRPPNDTIPVHLPFIATLSTNVENAHDPHRRLESMRITNRREEQYMVWLLARERITLDTSPDAWPVGKITYQQSNLRPSVRPRGNGDERDVNWIPDMRRIWPEAARLRRECLHPGKDAAVAVQLTLHSGKLHSQFRPNTAQSEPPSEFDPVKTAPVRHVLTRQALFVAQLPDRTHTLTIQSHSIDTGRSLRPIKLEVRGEPIDLIVGNTDLDDLVKTVEDRETTEHHHADIDFELYYDLLDLPRERDGLPVPLLDPGQGGHADCPKLRVTLPGGTE